MIQTIFFFLSALIASRLINAYYSHFYKKLEVMHTSLLLSLEIYFKNLAMLFFLIFFAELLSSTLTGLSLYSLWDTAPGELDTIILLFFLLFSCFIIHKNYKLFNDYDYLTSIRKNNNPKDSQKKLYLLLIDYEASELLIKERLSLFKSFSPVPIFLLLLNNLKSISFENLDIKSFLSSDTSNLFLILGLVIYLFMTYLTYMKLETNSEYVRIIKKELYHLS